MKNIKQNTKALTPVIASIILVTVAIAVTLATGGWLGAMASHYTGTTGTTASNVEFAGTPSQQTNGIVLTMKNTGTKVVTVELIKVNGKSYTYDPPTGGNTTYIPAETKELTVNNVSWQAASTYDVAVYANGGHTVGAYRATSPAA